MPGCRLLFFSLNNERVAAVQKSIIIRGGQAGAQSGEANQEVIPLNTGHPMMQLERLLWLLVMDKRLFQSSSNQYYIQKQQVMYSKLKITPLKNIFWQNNQLPSDAVARIIWLCKSSGPNEMWCRPLWADTMLTKFSIIFFRIKYYYILVVWSQWPLTIHLIIMPISESIQNALVTS